MRVNLCWLMVGALALAASLESAFAQERYVRLSDGTLVQYQSTEQVIQQQVIQQQTIVRPSPSHCAGCDTTCKDCTPTLRHKNHPDCDCKENCQPLDTDPVGEVETLVETVAFYKEVKAFQKMVKVPVILERTEEVIKFDKKKIDLLCCEIEICVPCERCEKKTKKCELREKMADLEARVRTCNGMVDVVVLNVPGMPKEWVVALCISKAEAKARFGVDL